MIVRGGSGLGDSVYLRVVAEYLVSIGKSVSVRTHYPEVFIGSGAATEPFSKENVDLIAHYHADRSNQRSTQWQDILRCAKLPDDLPLRFDWPIKNHALVKSLRIKAKGRPIIVVQGGRAAFGRVDGIGSDLVPRAAGFAATLDAMADCFRVRVGKGEQHYALPVDLNLHDQTSVSDLIDIVSTCDGVVTQCGFPVPMAECFGVPVLAVWSARGLVSGQVVVRKITPAKILTAPTSRYLIDEWPAAQIRDAARAFVESLEHAEVAA